MTEERIDGGLEKGPAPSQDNAPRKSGSVLQTVVTLTIASLLVGAVLAILGLSPIDFWTGLVDSIRHFIEGLLNIGWETVSTVVSYIILGAMIVVPVWLVAKLLSMARSRR